MAPLGWGVPAAAHPGCWSPASRCKAPQELSKGPSPSASSRVKALALGTLLNSQGRGAGCEAGAARQPNLVHQQFPTELPMDFIPCIFSFSRAFSSISRSKAADPFSSVPPPGS